MPDCFAPTALRSEGDESDESDNSETWNGAQVRGLRSERRSRGILWERADDQRRSRGSE